MKKLTVIAAIVISLTSNVVLATGGGKVRPPVTYKAAELMTGGGKVRPPVTTGAASLRTGGGKVRPPQSEVVINTGGGKVRPPASNVVTQDSGAFSLSDIFSQYFSF